MLLKEDDEFWDLYKETGDYLFLDMKVDAGKKFGDFLDGEIFAVLKKSEDDNFRRGWIVRKANGQLYLFVFYEQLDYMLVITSSVDLLQK